MVRVGSYDSTNVALADYNKNSVDILAPADNAVNSSAAAAKLSGAVSQLIANSGSKSDANSTDWWTALSTTVINIDDVITLTDEQLNGLSAGDQKAIDEFMRPLGEYLQSAIDQLQTELSTDENSQALLELIGSALKLTDLSAYSTDINLDGNQSDINDLWNELWNDLGE